MDLLVAVADLLVAADPLDLAVLRVLADLQVLLDPLVAAVVQVAEVMEDIDPSDFYNLDISKDGLALIYRSVCFHLEKWPGGHPQEQEALVQLKDNLFRIILEKTLET